MQEKEILELSKDINNYIMDFDYCYNNVETLKDLDKEIDDLREQINRLEKTDTNDFHLERLKEIHDMNAISYNELLALHKQNLIILWQETSKILKTMNKVSDEDLRNNYPDLDIQIFRKLQANIKDKNKSLQPPFKVRLKYKINQLFNWRRCKK
ncbi:hypothetical protein NOU10_00115 [Ligilactobacillus sp. MP3]|uniref:hypothetical protein n=1 Tax=Ligilactobacillus sp. MP3 TaxID=2965103 RepID=UPI00210A4ECE|nr:hypothetical protein [Ligilactobacillus sp. MP3]MCQ4115793.1 hypothetical protein [Ligilactobacillus sp. MP3]